MANYRAIVEYDGTEYSGFQIQVDQLTIQGALEEALRRVTQEKVRVHGAGRTDAGVHARGQVISFETAWTHTQTDLQRAMNALLPADIAVRDVAVVDARFHARFSARSRTYVYRLYMGEVRSPLLDRFAHHVPHDLDVESMRRATAQLIGRRDFAAFGQPTSGGNTVRYMYRADWSAWTGEPFVGSCGSIPQLRLEVEANGFLHGMIRRLVATLILVGRGRLKVKDFSDILVSRDIGRPGVLAPPCGLCLWRVRYDNGFEGGAFSVNAMGG
ncbi:MAG: tRNA pseudouridine(38-40) synthase TruA [Chloroflexota bacterium]|nr:tRNA pseudouridine(38-40) synthase TruA [Chloroflexota bacterium]